MRFCYIGHSFHERSKSTVFLLDLLKELGSVEAYSSDPDGDRASDDQLATYLSQKTFDCFVFLQTEYFAARLRPVVSGRFVLVPMFDGAAGVQDVFWRQFVHDRFISFCRLHHEHLEALDCRSACFQFFPELQAVPQRNLIEPDAFFWERRPDTVINLSLVVNLCHQIGVRTLHIHAAPDFLRHARTSSRRSKSQAQGIAISSSDWFDRREDYQAVAGAPVFFFAPRLQEGIGMAVLEAMSRGQIVVAPDRPTVNEYVSHGTTGILYDPEDAKIDLPLGEAIIERMSAAARRKIEDGRADWLIDVDRLKSILLDDRRRWSTRDVSSHFMNLLRRSASKRRFEAQTIAQRGELEQ